ncbi:MAG: radical SAM protein [Gaiellales bacterium]|nr:MAG: radical SAM protein [Gaiellales bacterium]
MDCPGEQIPRAGYGSFSKRIHSLVRERVPVGGSIEFTARCNLGCVHCFVKDNRSPGLGLEEWQNVLDQVADAGCFWLQMTGGEPLLRPDFRELYLYTKKKGFLVTLFTNATLMTPEIADLLAEWPPFAVEVSLYGASPESYQKVTGSADAYDRCMEGIALLKDRGLPLRLKSMVLAENRDDLQTMMDLARGLGAEFRYDANIHGRVDGDMAPGEHRLSPEEVLELDFLDRRRISALKEFVDYCERTTIDDEQLYHCGAGLNSFHIDAAGNLCLCIMVRDGSRPILESSFRELWETEIPRLRFRKAPAGYSCKGCELYSLCGQCPGWGRLDEGGVDSRSDFLCRLAHLRAQAYRDVDEWIK